MFKTNNLVIPVLAAEYQRIQPGTDDQRCIALGTAAMVLIPLPSVAEGMEFLSQYIPRQPQA